MVQRGLSSVRPRELILTHEEKFIFLECVQINSVGLKLDRPRCTIGYCFHNIIGLDVAAGLPVPMSYDCDYDLACNSSSPFDPE